MVTPPRPGHDRPCTCEDRNIENGIAFDLLLDWGMTAYPAGTRLPDADADRKPIPPWQTRDGRYIRVKAVLRDDYGVEGLLIARDGNRFVLLATLDDGEPGGYVTFNADTALMVGIHYVGDPKATT